MKRFVVESDLRGSYLKPAAGAEEKAATVTDNSSSEKTFPRVIGMIPVRMGSQRLQQKNLRQLGGIPLVTRAIRKCLATRLFDQVWVNSEHPTFEKIALAEGVRFHKRPPELADNRATSEQFVYEFLKAHPCELLFQVHSIAPLLTAEQLTGFVDEMMRSSFDVLLSVVEEQIECLSQERPLNFSFERKTNSQELCPVQRITWSVTGWRSATFIRAFEDGQCATYAGNVGVYPINRLAGHVIKTEEDLVIAQALLGLVEGSQN